MKLKDAIQTADWKKEKHTPVIECPDEVKANEPFVVTVTVGKDIPHPNTTEHFIAWIDVFFQPEGSKFAHHVGRFDFRAHGESAKGPNKGPVYAHPSVTFAMQVSEPGTLMALSHCNIHGLWGSEKALKLA